MPRPDARRAPAGGGEPGRRPTPRESGRTDKAQAGLIIRRSVVYEDGDMADLVLRRGAGPSSAHAVTYSFAYHANGRRVVGFDDVDGAGPRRHVGDQAVPYRFEGAERLLADFSEAVEAWRSAHGKR